MGLDDHAVDLYGFSVFENRAVVPNNLVASLDHLFNNLYHSRLFIPGFAADTSVPFSHLDGSSCIGPKVYSKETEKIEQSINRLERIYIIPFHFKFPVQ